MPRVEFTKSRRKRIGIIVGSLLVFAFVLVISLVPSKRVAQADSGPDGVYYKHGTSTPVSQIYYTVSDTKNVTSPKTIIPVYSSTLPHTRPAGPTVVSISYLPNGSSVTFTTGGTTSLDNPDSVTIPGGAAGWTLDSNSGMYYALITAQLSSGKDTSLRFKVNTPAGTIIGYSNINDQSFAVANAQRCDQPFDDNNSDGSDTTGCGTATNASDPTSTWGKYYDYSLPFAPPCTTNTHDQTIVLYDPDNPRIDNDRASIQPDRFLISLIDDTDGTVVGYTDANGIAHGYTVVIQDGAASDPAADRHPPLAGPPNASDNKSTEYITFSAKKQHKYTLHLDNVYTNNVLQFKLPFDSINHQVTCTTPFGNTPTLSRLPTRIPAGSATTVHFTGRVISTGANHYALSESTTVSYATLLSAATGPNINTVDGNSYNGTVGNNGPYIYSYSISPPANTPDGTILYFKFTVTPHSNLDTNPITVTVSITVDNPRAPTLNVAAGDVHVGCPTTGNSNSNIATNDGSGGVEVVSASGVINGFNSAINSSAASAEGYTPSTTNPLCKPDLIAAADNYLLSHTAPALPVLTGTVNLTSLTAPVYVANSDLVISGAVNRRITIYVRGNHNLTVNGNVTVNSGTAYTRATLPSLGVIVSGSIFFKPSGTTMNEVDGFYWARNTINTCAQIGGGTVNCNNVLQVNGLLIAHDVKLQRWGLSSASGSTLAENIAIAGQLYLNPPEIFGSDTVNIGAYGTGENEPRF